MNTISTIAFLTVSAVILYLGRHLIFGGRPSEVDPADDRRYRDLIDGE